MSVMLADCYSLDGYSQLLLTEIDWRMEQWKARRQFYINPKPAPTHVRLLTDAVALDPHASSFAKRLERMGLHVELPCSTQAEDSSAAALTVDIGHPALLINVPTDRVTIAEASRMLGMTQVGSIRHSVTDTTAVQIDALLRVARSLDDELSRNVALAAICDQLAGVPRYVYDVTEASAPPYVLTDLFEHSPEESVADVGAADGDTMSDFVSLPCPPKLYRAFEGDTLLLKRLRARADHWRDRSDISISEKIVSDEIGPQQFVWLAGTGASHIATSASDLTKTWPMATEVLVDATTLDSEYEQKSVSLIKIDVEGHELAVLRGGLQTIVRDRPVLAVAGYHEADDLASIVDLLRDNVREYCYFFRKYSFGSFDTDTTAGMFFLESIIYAVPKERCIRHMHGDEVPDGPGTR